MHMAVVRRMYALRFPNMDTSRYSLQQIRGMEGIRVRKAYELAAKTSGVKWSKRSYKKEDWESADPINRALSQANAMLYGVCHAAIVSLGYSTGLGFVHTGKQLSFVYDIADLCKVNITIPAAFEAVRSGGDLERETRLACRKYFAAEDLLAKIAEDIAWVLRVSEPEDKVNGEVTGDLWDEGSIVQGGKNYGE